MVDSANVEHGHADRLMGSVSFAYHVVVFVDLLGQGQAMLEWDFIPETPAEKERFIRKVKDSLGKIVAFRILFQRTIEAWIANSQLPESLYDNLPDTGSELRQFTELDIRQMNLSDTVVAHAPIVNPNGIMNASLVTAFVVTTGTAQLLTLSAGTAVRGGIEFGVAARTDETELQGPAMVNAHYLESRVAEYPRIVVGRGLVQLLHDFVENPEVSSVANSNRASASVALDLLRVDADDEWTIDFLGDKFAQLSKHPLRWRGFQRKALSFAATELARFQEAGNMKLCDRYQRLVDYGRSCGLPA